MACGVLINAQGEVLVAQRPAGKIAAGRWEFPGGKIEPGESPRDALIRELREELAIEVTLARPLIRIVHDYSDRTVLLDTWLVSAWRGKPLGQENQALAWCRPERLSDFDLLEADGPIVNALRLPSDYVFTPPQMDLATILKGIARLPPAALFRLRLPGLSAVAYEALARSVIERVGANDIRVILDREPQQAADLGAAGWHCNSAKLAALRQRPVPPEVWFCGSAHDADQLKQLRKLGADCAVLGPVQATASHPGQASLGWKIFSDLTASAGLPVYAIGGVGPQQRARTHHCYAQGTAGISAYWDSE